MDRVYAFLEDLNPDAADAAADAILEAALSLRELPNRGVRGGAAYHRELIVRHGRYGYIIQYRVRDDEVLIARVFHGLEDRRQT